MRRKDVGDEEKKEKADWQPDGGLVDQFAKELKAEFEHGRKNTMSNPDRASLTDPGKDGRQEYEKWELKPDDDYILACAKVGAFLADREAVEAQSVKLNELVKQKIGDGEPTPKALREVLEEELGRMGFHPHFAKAYDNIEPVDFRALVADGLLIKDAAIGNEGHGEFTHPIQWLLIAWQQRDTNFLGQDAVNVFKRMGEEESVFIRDPVFEGYPVRGRREEQSIWDRVVDRFSSLNKEDFRCPANLNRFIMTTDNPDMTLLKELLHKRTQKRQEARKADKEFNATLKNKYQNPSTFFHASKKVKSIHLPNDHEEVQSIDRLKKSKI